MDIIRFSGTWIVWIGKTTGVDSILNTVLNHKALGNGSIILCHNGAKIYGRCSGCIAGRIERKRLSGSADIATGFIKKKYHMDVTGRQIPDAK